IDELGVSRGNEPMFTGVTLKACKTRWETLFNKHHKRVKTVLEKTGSVPIETQHDQRIDNLYSDHIDYDKNKAGAKEANENKRKRQQEKRSLGAAIRSASLEMAGYRSQSSATEDDGSSSSSSTSTLILFIS
ncbi:hypothetical protein BGZ95_006480, partial [Linnemannia exigua]